VVFTLTAKNVEDLPKWQRIKALEGVVLFSQGELEGMFNRMEASAQASTLGKITKEHVLKNNPELSEGIDIIFNIFDPQHDGVVQYEDFIKVVGIATRGRIEDRIKLAYHICDLDGNGYVDKDEVIKICSIVSSIMQKLGYDKTDYGDPQDIADRMFSHPADGQEISDKGISKEEFLRKAQTETDLANCFGLFAYLNKKWVEPFMKSYGEFREKQGNLFMKRKILWMNFPVLHRFEVRGGFLACRSAKRIRYYKDVMDLQYCMVRDTGHLHFTALRGSQKWTLRAQTPNGKNDWVEALRSNKKKEFRAGSFAGINNSTSNWFINGKEFFDGLLPAIHAAKQHIFLGGWYFSPGLYLKRNPPDPESQLDKVLVKKASQGIRIYIIIWSGNQLAYHLDAKQVRNYLNGLHPNIRAVTHPLVMPMSWSHHQKFVVVDEDIAFLGGIDLAYNRYDDNRYLLTDPDEVNFPGRDYTNFSKFSECNQLPNEPPTNSVDRTVSRTPWHDIAVCVEGQAARDVAFNFIQKWNHIVKSANKKEREFLMPKSQKEKQHLFLDKESNYQDCTVQVIRSACDWSFGIEEVERSIEKAYLYAIQLAQHLIYIENQYFISGIDQNKPKNRILKALYERVKIAIQKQEQFKIIVVLPVHPAGDPTSYPIRYIMKYTYESINRPGSLIYRLKAEFPGVDLSKYLGFYALRNWGMLNGIPVTEQIYVHAKLMIVDDRVVIVGSANINDRSMLGSHDSEIGLVVHGGEMQTSQMAGKTFKVSKFAHEMRMRLWRDYLGLEESDMSIEDPLSEETYNNKWLKTAQENTKIYKNIFQYLPDNVVTVDDFKVRKEAGPQDEEQLKAIRGYLIEFPFNFLNMDKLPPIPMLSLFI
jgi:phospholipase D1/2